MLAPLSLTAPSSSSLLPDEAGFRNQVRRATLLPAAILALLAVLLAALVVFLFGATEWAEHSQRVISQASVVALLGDDAYLNGSVGATSHPSPVEVGAKVDAAFGELKTMVRDRKAQQDLLNLAQTQFDAWYKAATHQQPARPGPPANSADGQAVDPAFAAFKASLKMFVANEEELQAFREARVRILRNTALGLLLLTVFAGAPLLMAYLNRVIRHIGNAYQTLLGTTAAQRDELYTSLRSIGDAVLVTDALGIVTFLNPVAEKLTGWAADEALGHSLAEVLPLFNEQTGQAAENPVERVLREKLVVGLANHTVLRPRNGHQIPIEDSAAPIFDGRGEMRGVVLVFHDVSEKHERERALRESEWISRTALEVAGAGAWNWDIERDRVIGDSVLSRTFNIPVDLCRSGAPIASFIAAIHPDDRARVEQGIGDALLNSDSFILDYRVIGQDGVERWVDGRGRVERDAAGKPMRLPGILLDITVQKTAELERDRLIAEKEQQRRLYEAILGSTPDFVYVFGLDHRFRFANTSLLSAWGKSAAEALGRNCLELGYEKWHAEKHDREIEQVVATRKPIFGEVPFSAKGTGGRRIYDYIFVPVFDASGEVVSVAGTTRDVTARKQAEQIESIQNRVFELIIQGAPLTKILESIVGMVEEHSETGMMASILLVDPDGQHLSTAAAPRLPAAYSREINGIPIGEGVGSCGTAAARKQPVYVADIANDPLWGRFADLAERHGLRACWSTPFFSGDGTLLGTLSMYYSEVREPNAYELRSVAAATRLAAIAIESRRSEENLRRAKETAESANRAKDDFLAALSHELRTPLTPVLMTAAAFREDPRLPDDVRHDLAMVERNILLEAKLIDDLLDLTRIAKGKLRLRATECDVHSLIGLAVDIVRDDAQAKPVHLNLHLEAHQFVSQGDPARLQQVFWNILRNAIKFTPEGGNITVRTSDGPENRLFISISDTGIGLDPTSLENIFLPFEQGGRDQGHRFGGLGLGLAIARAIVDLHGGIIRAESAGAGLGATFVVELPGATIGDPSVRPTSPSPTGPTSNEVSSATKALKILLLEDHEPTLAVLSRLLTRSGHLVVTASSVAAAVSIATSNHFDVLVSDLGLPDGTGIEAIGKLRSLQPTLRGIALSGYGMEEDIRRSLDAGFAAHLTKPVDVDHLRRVLREVASEL